ncbi:MAG TPA: hypothetical protein DCF44_02755 [Chitinophagaceae bacterium]|nr:hypothetical protein [Chitinophagaceae bacterium]
MFGTWKPNYEFQLRKADEVVLIPPGKGIGQGRQIDSSWSSFQPRFNYPFSNQLEINFGVDLISSSQVAISLFDSSTRKVAFEQIGGAIISYSLQTKAFLPGLYYLVIETDFGVKVFKVIKSN